MGQATWKTQELADKAGLSYPTSHQFESGLHIAAESLAKLEKALVDAGASFIDRAGRVGVTVPKP